MIMFIVTTAAVNIRMTDITDATMAVVSSSFSSPSTLGNRSSIGCVDVRLITVVFDGIVVVGNGLSKIYVVVIMMFLFIIGIYKVLYAYGVNIQMGNVKLNRPTMISQDVSCII